MPTLLRESVLLEPDRGSGPYHVKGIGEAPMIPVAAANIYVPYHVVLPTYAGAASITSTSVLIDVPGKGRIALRNE